MIIFVVAHDQNYGIGMQDRWPWPRMATDVAHFQRVIKSKIIVMGGTTYRACQGMKFAFTGAKGILVLSRTMSQLPNASVISDIKEIIKMGDNTDIYVIGGGEIFTQLLDYANKMYITEIKGTFKADAFFPRYSMDEWQVIESKECSADASNPFAYTFLTLLRK